MATTNPLEKEFQFYLDHQDDLVKQHEGRVVVIKGQKVLSVYDDEAAAILETEKTEELGTFLVQRCTPGDDAYTNRFHSRVSFA
jgi:hypothetical protein